MTTGQTTDDGLMTATIA